MKRLRFQPSFSSDLIDIWLRLSEYDQNAADRQIDAIMARCSILETFSHAGPARTDLAPDCRMLVEGNYLILYVPNTETVDLVRVLHGRRRIEPSDLAE